MKVTIDTKYKTITLEEQISLQDLDRELSKLLPDWKDYKLIPKVIYNNGSFGMGTMSTGIGLQQNPTPVSPPYNPLIFGPSTTGKGLPPWPDIVFDQGSSTLKIH